MYFSKVKNYSTLNSSLYPYTHTKLCMLTYEQSAAINNYNKSSNSGSSSSETNWGLRAERTSDQRVITWVRSCVCVWLCACKKRYIYMNMCLLASTTGIGRARFVVFNGYSKNWQGRAAAKRLLRAFYEPCTRMTTSTCIKKNHTAREWRESERERREGVSQRGSTGCLYLHNSQEAGSAAAATQKNEYIVWW